IYYDTGDLVLLSLPRKDGVITAFKVDKIYLSRSSPIFDRMLSLPVPSPDIAQVESFASVPLVHMQDDAEDLTCFLMTLYDYRQGSKGFTSSCSHSLPLCHPLRLRKIPIKRNKKKTVDAVRGILNLTIKYEVDMVQEPIIDLLSSDWPSELEMWDR
ncbi:hypothetical protein K439DRAFT_1299699, partial [Ramaria rubella]